MGYLNEWKIALKGESPFKPLKEFNTKTEIPDWARENERMIAEIRRNKENRYDVDLDKMGQGAWEGFE